MILWKFEYIFLSEYIFYLNDSYRKSEKAVLYTYREKGRNLLSADLFPSWLPWWEPRSDQSREPGILSKFPTWMPGPQVFGPPSVAFPGSLT